MAGGRLYWNNVAAPDFSAGFSGLRTASDLFNKSIDNGVAAVNSYINAKEESAARDLQAQIIEAGLNNDRERMAALMTNPLLKRVSTDKAKQATQLGFNMLKDQDELALQKQRLYLAGRGQARLDKQEAINRKAASLYDQAVRDGITTGNFVGSQDYLTNLYKGLDAETSLALDNLFKTNHGVNPRSFSANNIPFSMDSSTLNDFLTENNKDYSFSPDELNNQLNTINTVERVLSNSSPIFNAKNYNENLKKAEQFSTLPEMIHALKDKLGDADPLILQDEIMKVRADHNNEVSEAQVLAAIASGIKPKALWGMGSGIGTTGIGGSTAFDDRRVNRTLNAVKDNSEKTNLAALEILKQARTFFEGAKAEIGRNSTAMQQILTRHGSDLSKYPEAQKQMVVLWKRNDELIKQINSYIAPLVAKGSRFANIQEEQKKRREDQKTRVNTKDLINEHLIIY